MTPRNDHAGESTRVFDRLLILVGIIGVAAMVLAIFAAMRSADATTPTGPTVPSTPDQIASIELADFSITGDLNLQPGGVILDVTNVGAIPHNLVLETGPRTRDLNNNESQQLDLGSLEAGNYTIYCDIPGHRQSGMEAVLAVGSGEANGGDDHDHGPNADWPTLDQKMLDSMLAFPAATEGRGNQVLEPRILADGTKEYDITVAITPWEVEPGKWVEAWTYNGIVPGPQLRVDVGDRIRVVVKNDLPAATDIHWHGLIVPNDMDGVAPITQDPIWPGETFVYEFDIREPGIAMYHAHLHGQVAIPNGLFGTIIAGDYELPAGRVIGGREIPEDIEISQEITMVLNDAGVIGLSLNGKSFPATEPYFGKVGDWVAVHYYNEGMLVHPMHQHQFPQLVFLKDGFPLDQPYWSDVVNVAPGERYTVLFNLTDPGVWVWHCHILSHAERTDGMFGMVTAFIVEEG